MKRDKTGKFTQAWNGESKQAAKLSLTNTAWQLLEQQSREMGVSRSELVERYARHFQCHCCARNKTASSNGEASGLSQTVIIKLHGGTIHAESAGEGQGATFTVKLPLVSTSTIPTQEEAVVNRTLALQGIKVLAVDDEIDNLELATFILEEAGASVVAVSSAPEVLQVLAQTKPNIFLFDIGMPQIDGYTLLRQIRTLEVEQGDRPVPAIALTAYVGKADQQQALAAGFQQHIPKPVEPEVVLQAILSLIGS